MSNITIPFNFHPRDYQIPVYDCLPNGYRRGVVIWHRRAGKDKTFINILAREALKRVGSYFYILPYYKQARKIIWEGMDSQGFKFIDHFPPQIIKRKDNQQMTIELINGSMIYMLGSDNVDSIVGTNPIGVIFSEFSLHKPQAWYYLRPILIENGGWALFNGTPRGKNELWNMLRYARSQRDWFSEVLTIDDTRKPDGSPVVTAEDIENERLSGMPEELIQQEYFCSFDAGLVGAYLSDQMNEAAREGRITRVPWSPNLPVITGWDLGFNDTNTIWFAQIAGREVRVFNLYQNNHKIGSHYAQKLLSYPYSYAEHFLPHDGTHHEFMIEGTRAENYEKLGIRPVTTVPRLRMSGERIPEAVAFVRQVLPKCVFDAKNCDLGIEALKSWRREYDEKRKVFADHEEHDWASHFAAGFRSLAYGISVRQGQFDMIQTSANAEWDELDPWYKAQYEDFNELDYVA